MALIQKRFRISDFGFRIESGWPHKSAIRNPQSAILLSCLILLAGCKVGPNFKPPQTSVPQEWAGPLPPSPVGPEPNLAVWWTQFNDPMLTSLVNSAIGSNLDLQVAQARIRQARAARGVAIGGLGPSVNATGSFRRGQSPGLAGVDSFGPTTNLYQAGFDAAWEIDVFGGVRRGVEAANADLLAAIESRWNVFITLTSEVAVNYIDLRSLQQEIVIAQENLKAQEHSADLTRQRRQGGLASGLDVANAEAQVANTATQIPVLETSVQQTIYSLSVLLGREPGALLADLSTSAPIPTAPPAVPVVVPSELLRRRPDVRQAEAQIHGATARIGVAVADLFPTFSLSASIGRQGNKFSSLSDRLNRFWSVGPSASWNLFATGRNLSNIDLQKALEEESLIIYRQVVLGSLQEVENALIALAKEQEHRTALIDAVAANRKVVNLATELYTQGQTDFLNVLNAQRSLYTAEDALVQSNRAVSTNLVALYKALGGGWQAEEPSRSER